MKKGYRPMRGPKKFVRPSIEIGGHGKVWQDIRAIQARVGDMWQDHGAVRVVSQGDGSGTVYLFAGERTSPFILFEDETMRVFGEPR